MKRKHLIAALITVAVIVGSLAFPAFAEATQNGRGSRKLCLLHKIPFPLHQRPHRLPSQPLYHLNPFLLVRNQRNPAVFTKSLAANITRNPAVFMKSLAANITRNPAATTMDTTMKTAVRIPTAQLLGLCFLRPPLTVPAALPVIIGTNCWKILTRPMPPAWRTAPSYLRMILTIPITQAPTMAAGSFGQESALSFGCLRYQLCDLRKLFQQKMSQKTSSGSTGGPESQNPILISQTSGFSTANPFLPPKRPRLLQLCLWRGYHTPLKTGFSTKEHVFQTGRCASA